MAETSRHFSLTRLAMVAAVLSFSLLLTSASPFPQDPAAAPSQTNQQSSEIPQQPPPQHIPGPVKNKEFMGLNAGGISDILGGAVSVISGIVRMSRTGDGSGDSSTKQTFGTVGTVLGVVESIMGIFKSQFCRLFSGLFGAGEGGTPCGGNGRGWISSGDNETEDVSEDYPAQKIMAALEQAVEDELYDEDDDD